MILGLSDCDDEKIVEKKMPAPIVQKREDFSDELRSIIEEMTENGEEDVAEFTVDVPIAEDGNIPVDFDYSSAIRDCIESSGELQCITGFNTGYQKCYAVDQYDSNTPFTIVPGYRSVIFNSQVKSPMFIKSRGESFADVESYFYDSFKPYETKKMLNAMCNDAITQYRESDKLDFDFEDLEWIEMEYDLFDLSDEFFNLATESGLEVKDEGGTTQTMIIDGVEIEVIYMVDFAREATVDNDWSEPSVKVKAGENDYFHSFLTADEALQFLQE